MNWHNLFGFLIGINDIPDPLTISVYSPFNVKIHSTLNVCTTSRIKLRHFRHGLLFY